MTRHIFVAALSAALLSGCAQTAAVGTAISTASNYSVTQATVDGLRSAYDGAFLAPVVAYRNLGICPAGTTATIAKPCADRSTVLKLQAADKTVEAGFAATQAQIDNGNSVGLSAAFASLQTAVATAESLAVNLGVSK